jgi:hypothetical protein
LKQRHGTRSRSGQPTDEKKKRLREKRKERKERKRGDVAALGVTTKSASAPKCK